MSRIGVSFLPAPFRNMLTIMSDCDGSDRHTYNAVVQHLVGKYSLDFADSRHLFWDPPRGKRDADLAPAMVVSGGLAFLPPLGGPASGAEVQYAVHQTLNENLIEFYRGNIDTLHGLNIDGIRGVVYEATEFSNDGARIRLDTTNLAPTEPSTLYFRFRGLAVCGGGACAATPRLRRVAIEFRDSRPRLESGAVADVSEGIYALDDAARFDPAEIASLTLEFMGAVDSVTAITLLNETPSRIRNGIRLLKEHGVSIPNYTEHSAFLLFSGPSLNFHEANYGIRADDTCTKRAHYLRLPGCDSRLSTLIDDESSVFFLMPELHDLGVRFYNPAGLTADNDLHRTRLDFVRPARTRGSTQAYVYERCLPSVKLHADQREVPTTSRANTFPERSRTAIKLLDEHEGHALALYTHLGLTDSATDGHEVGAHFERDGIRTLADAHFGTNSPTSRAWVVSPSVFLNTALLNRNGHLGITRKNANSICVSPWKDPVLGSSFPDDIAQLHGLTFRVGDPAKARLYFRGQVLRRFAVNRPDPNGAAVVTFVGYGPSRSLLSDTPLDEAVARCPDDFRWVQAIGPSVSRLDGAQYLTISVRSRGEISGLRVHLRGSAGDLLMTDEPDDCSHGERARFRLPSLRNSRFGHDETLFVPLYDLSWRGGGDTEVGRFISGFHTVEIEATLASRASLRIDDLCLLRPVVTIEAQAWSLVRLAGRVAGGAGVEVVLRHLATGEETTARCDALGYFFCKATPPGACEIGVRGGEPRRIDVRHDVLDLELAGAG